jgi:plasminogen activator inhibitor 1 RNA-binding protein
VLDDSDDDQPVTTSRPSSSSHRTVETSSKNLTAVDRGSHQSANTTSTKKGDYHNHNHSHTSTATTATTSTAPTGTSSTTSSNIRSGRGGRVPSREGKRAYDRRSGTGRGREIKKGGGGARNWGSDQNEARNAEQQPTSLAHEDVALPEEEGEVSPRGQEEEQQEAEQQQQQNEGAEITEEPQRTPEEEDRTMTLDEYLKKKAEDEQQQKLASEAFKTLAIKDSVVDETFATKSALKKDEQEFLFMGEGKKPRKKSSTSKQQPKSEKLVVDIRVGVPTSFGSPSGSGRGSRRGRREGDNRSMAAGVDGTALDRSDGRKGRHFEGGGRGRGGGRGARPFSGRGRADQTNTTIPPKFDVADTTAFPSL